MDIEGNISVDAGGAQEEIVTNDRSLIVTGDDTSICRNRSEATLGERKVTVTGMNTVIADGVEIHGGGASGVVAGVITELSVCPYTGSPHVNGSQTVKVSA